MRRVRRYMTTAGALGLGGCATLSGQGANHATIVAVPVALEETAPARDRLGAMRYLGGLVLTSGDRRFGGLSALRWDAGRLVALSDQDGAWFAMTPVETGDRLTGIGAVETTRLRDDRGLPLTGKQESDAESMNLVVGRCAASRCPAHAVSVGFERDDRILTYRLRDGLPIGKPQRLKGIDRWLGRQPDNLGVEAMAGDRAVTLMVSEGLKTPGGGASALLFRPGLNGAHRPRRAPVEIGIPAPGGMRPSDLAQIDDTHFVLVRRVWSRAAGFAVEIERLTLAGDTAVTTLLARFVPPVVTDNYEGAAIRQERGRTFLYLISDDNFEPRQRTLLLKFEITG